MVRRGKTPRRGKTAPKAKGRPQLQPVLITSGLLVGAKKPKGSTVGAAGSASAGELPTGDLWALVLKCV